MHSLILAQWDDALRDMCRDHSRAMGEKLCQFGHDNFAERNQLYIEKSPHFVASLYAYQVFAFVCVVFANPEMVSIGRTRHS